MKHLTVLLMVGGLFFACSVENAPTDSTTPTPVLQEEIIHYYSVRHEGDRPVRDSLKDCFSCNQSTLFDSTGRELELRFYQGKGPHTFGIDRYDYDEQGRKTGSRYYERDSLINRYTYGYNDLGQFTTSQATNAATGKPLYGSIRNYDELGNCTETDNQNADGIVVNSYRRTFNENGIAMTEHIVDTSGDIRLAIRYDYRPTADSNWVEQLTYYNEELKEIRYRERKYW